MRGPRISQQPLPCGCPCPRLIPLSISRRRWGSRSRSTLSLVFRCITGLPSYSWKGDRMSVAKDLSRPMSWGRAHTRLCELVLAAGLMFSMAIFPAVTYAHDIRIAAATELKFLFEDVSSQFQQKSAHQVSLVCANSGALFEKIKNGERFDLFFRAICVTRNGLSKPARVSLAHCIDSGSAV